MEGCCQEKWPVIVVAAIIAAGLVIGGFFIGHGFYSSRMSDRYVTVKGLAEKDVVADLAVWTIKLSATGDVVTDVQANIDSQVATLKEFLKEQKFKDDEVSAGQYTVTDLMAQEWRSERAERSRFIVSYIITIWTNDVEKARVASSKTSDLIKKGLVMVNDNGPNYIFTKLNEIKPEMIAAATKSARQAATQFAADSGSKVGKIRRATQGFFSIEPRDGSTSGSGDDTGAVYGEEKQIDKKVRVVSTIDYALE